MGPILYLWDTAGQNFASQEWRGAKEGLAGGLLRKGGWQIAQLLVSRKLGGHGCRRFMCGDKALGKVKGQSPEQGKQLLPALRVPGSADEACKDTVFRKTYFVPLGELVPPDRCYWCTSLFLGAFPLYTGYRQGSGNKVYGYL